MNLARSPNMNILANLVETVISTNKALKDWSRPLAVSIYENKYVAAMNNFLLSLLSRNRKLPTQLANQKPFVESHARLNHDIRVALHNCALTV